jgi:hypothetical protein
MEKKFVMSITFINGRFVEVGVDHAEFHSIKEKMFSALENDSVQRMENLCFRMSQVAFVAFYEKPEQNPDKTPKEAPKNPLS